MERTEDEPLPAGSFTAWLDGMQRALAGDGGSDVPCGGCTACCRSSQFVHIEPDEVETLARIPAELLFPAPRLPPGNVLLGYADNGHCPMLVDEGCSIYEHRPRTCRTYDCRIFAAAGVEIDDGRPLARQARRWRFDHPGTADRAHHDAVVAAAGFVRQHPDLLPEGTAPTNETQLAVLALQLRPAFLDQGRGGGCSVVAEPAVRVLLRSRGRSTSGR